MPPRFTMNHTPHSVIVKAVTVCKRRNCFSCEEVTPQLSYEVACKSVIWVKLARLLAFPGAVAIIVKNCAQPQMCWIYTGAVVATRAVVQHVQAFWDRTICKNPSNSWGAMRSPLSREKVAVAILVQASRPQPARIGFIYKRPKALLFASLFAFYAALMRAVVALGASNSCGFLVETLSAAITLKQHSKIFLLSVKGLAVRAASSAILSHFRTIFNTF